MMMLIIYIFFPVCLFIILICATCFLLVHRRTGSDTRSRDNCVWKQLHLRNLLLQRDWFQRQRQSGYQAIGKSPKTIVQERDSYFGYFIKELSVPYMNLLFEL